MKKLTVEQHEKLALHGWAAKRHLLVMREILQTVIADGGKFPDGLFPVYAQIEEMADSIETGVLQKVEDILLQDWPEATLQTYHGDAMYPQCVTLVIDDDPSGRKRHGGS